MTKWEYCEFRYQPGGFLSKKEAVIVYFTKNGPVIEDLGQNADEAKIISSLGEKGFEMVNCVIHRLSNGPALIAANYFFKRPIPER